MPDPISFYHAYLRIEERLGLSRGASQAKLRELCASGIVRLWKQPWAYRKGSFELETQGPEESILPSEWRSREIDLMTDTDGCQY